MKHGPIKEILAQKCKGMYSDTKANQNEEFDSQENDQRIPVIPDKLPSTTVSMSVSFRSYLALG